VDPSGDGRTVAAGPATAARYPSELDCDALLVDGSSVRIRPIRVDDADQLNDFHEHLSPETVYRRFFSPHPHLREAELRRFTRVDYRSRLALVAERHGDLVAVARFDRVESSDQAEVAFVVADAFQGLGLGTLLLEHLAVAARRRGIASFVADTLGSNRPMQEVFRQAGFACRQRWGGGVVTVTFPICPTEAYWQALGARDLQSVHAWIGAVGRRADGAGSHGTSGALTLTPGSGGSGLGARVGIARRAIRRTDRSGGALGGQLEGALVASLGPGIAVELTDLVAYLAVEPTVEVIVVELDEVAHPGRGRGRARAAARGKPVLGLLPGSRPTTGGRPSRRVDPTWWAQAGVEVFDDARSLLTRCDSLVSAPGGPASPPSDLGSLVELPDCDVAEARRLLDAASLERRPPTAGGPTRPARLARRPTAGLFEAYGLSGIATDGLPALRLAVSDDHGRGLCARLAEPDGAGRAPPRLLPLTDEDAARLAHESGVRGRVGERLAELLLRAARLVDDHGDLQRLELVTGASGGPTAPAATVWAGPVRGSEDDPFVRRLVARRPGGG
jgi:GNAT superfamily N-acetyltransferase